MREDERVWRRRINGYFNKQLKDLLDVIDKGSVWGLSAQIPMLWQDESLYNIYVDLYGRLGRKYYLESFNGITKNLRIRIKEEIDPLDTWWLSVQNFIDSEVAYRVVSVNDTTRKLAIAAIKEQIDLGIEQGLGIPEIKRNINRAVRDEWKHMKTFRPERIARTEVLSASNYASFQGALDTGVDVKKVWLHSAVKNERSWHLAYSGTAVELNDVFVLDGEPMRYPGDPRASAHNTINCRCVVTYES